MLVVTYQSNTYYSLVSGNNDNIPGEDDTIWTTNKTYIIVEQTPVTEVSVTGVANLTTTKLYYRQNFVENVKNTLITFLNNYQDSFNNLNIDIEYDYNLNVLNFKNRFTEDYLELKCLAIDSTVDQWQRFNNYSIGDKVVYRNIMYESTTNNVGLYPNVATSDWTNISDYTDTSNTISYLMNIEEQLSSYREITTNITKEFTLNLDFDNLDSFGLNLNVNGLDYDVAFDTDVTNTVSDWISIYSSDLQTLGVNVSSPLSNQILFESAYPNVDVSVIPNLGSLAVYRFKHSDLNITATTFNIFEIIINEVSYTVVFDTDTATTIQNWIDTYYYTLLDQNIEVRNLTPTTINFGKLTQDTTLEYTINLGQTFINYTDGYTITMLENGNTGNLIASNSILNNNVAIDLQEEGFSTAMIVSLSGSSSPLNNQDYNILLLDPDRIVLSYQGPFWNDTTSIINLKTRDFIRKPRFGFDDDPTSGFGDFMEEIAGVQAGGRPGDRKGPVRWPGGGHGQQPAGYVWHSRISFDRRCGLFRRRRFRLSPSCVSRRIGFWIRWRRCGQFRFVDEQGERQPLRHAWPESF